MTPPSGFSTPPQIPNNTTSERPPVTTTVFIATTPENTIFAYHASTSANPNPMIIPAFVEENYEILESLLREQPRQICNEDLRPELEYFSEDYDEEREMEPKPEPHREATPTIRPRSKRSSWDNNRGQKGRDRFSPYQGPNHGLLSNLSKIPREILPTEKAAKSFKQPPCKFGSMRSRDMSKYFHFHEDHGHDTNDGCQLRNQIEEAVKSEQLSHLVKGIKKERDESENNNAENGNLSFHHSRGHQIPHRRRDCHYRKAATGTLQKKVTRPPEGQCGVFAWTHVDMTGIPRAIMVKGKPFNTEQKLNEYSHVKPIKQKRRGLGPDRSTTACKEVEELMKAGIL
ncbi:hypothetical protein Tco_1066862 [Tanacetum coccineum]|uniref:Uncharacterized protein n=1 Tax=Tanacetum coccineum TaxID=301880 RepID=A0ABQ5HB82_9ASTR